MSCRAVTATLCPLQIRSLHRALQFRLREQLDRNLQESQRRAGVAVGVGLGLLAAASAVWMGRVLKRR
jgi:hypothetical protein